eukprot:TRINITY_DN7616_c0_g1_i2.p1 TRINITY_DN7616_c0_g1~~TRINITY_DN7616_c0_g1_i2.p1  ORF type:complete len:111 (-),score=24.17 TRINITY_DN7616_c0_g1_i2:275-583(-)
MGNLQLMVTKQGSRMSLTTTVVISFVVLCYTIASADVVDDDIHLHFYLGDSQTDNKPKRKIGPNPYGLEKESCSCGKNGLKKGQNRISGGSKAIPHEFPWTV